MCKCGCRGYDSIRPILKFIKWGLRCLASGTYPVTDWNGQPWADSAGWRKGKGGEDLGMVGALVQIRGDWEGWCKTFAAPTWADNNS
eukprot:3475040-Alexandrium_andersonii.AAC.1